VSFLVYSISRFPDFFNFLFFPKKILKKSFFSRFRNLSGVFWSLSAYFPYRFHAGSRIPNLSF